jgi:hypothetical protein
MGLAWPKAPTSRIEKKRPRGLRRLTANLRCRHSRQWVADRKGGFRE